MMSSEVGWLAGMGKVNDRLSLYLSTYLSIYLSSIYLR